MLLEYTSNLETLEDLWNDFILVFANTKSELGQILCPLVKVSKSQEIPHGSQQGALLRL